MSAEQHAEKTRQRGRAAGGASALGGREVRQHDAHRSRAVRRRPARKRRALRERAASPRSKTLPKLRSAAEEQPPRCGPAPNATPPRHAIRRSANASGHATSWQCCSRDRAARRRHRIRLSGAPNQAGTASAGPRYWCQAGSIGPADTISDVRRVRRDRRAGAAPSRTPRAGGPPCGRCTTGTTRRRSPTCAGRRANGAATWSRFSAALPQYWQR